MTFNIISDDKRILHHHREKYARMRKVGVPDRSIRNCMLMDGYVFDESRDCNNGDSYADADGTSIEEDSASNSDGYNNKRSGGFWGGLWHAVSRVSKRVITHSLVSMHTKQSESHAREERNEGEQCDDVESFAISTVGQNGSNVTIVTNNNTETNEGSKSRIYTYPKSHQFIANVSDIDTARRNLKSVLPRRTRTNP